MVTCPPSPCSCSPSWAPELGAVGGPSQPCAHVSPRWVQAPGRLLILSWSSA